MDRALKPHEQEALQKRPVPDERTDLLCPDCGAPMVLKVGKYGRFYGCSTWAETKCPGSHTATVTGAPTGIPAPKDVRALRKRVVERVIVLQTEWLHERDGNLIGVLQRDDFPKGAISTWNASDCLRSLRLLKGVVSRYDLIRLDEDFLDILGDVDPTA